MSSEESIGMLFVAAELSTNRLPSTCVDRLNNAALGTHAIVKCNLAYRSIDSNKSEGVGERHQIGSRLTIFMDYPSKPYKTLSHR